MHACAHTHTYICMYICILRNFYYIRFLHYPAINFSCPPSIPFLISPSQVDPPVSAHLHPSIHPLLSILFPSIHNYLFYF